MTGKTPDGSGKPRGRTEILRTKCHDLNDCQQLEQLAEKQKQEYDKCDKEKAKTALVGPVTRTAVAVVDTVPRVNNRRRSLLVDVRRKSVKMMVMMKTMNLVKESSKRLRRPYVFVLLSRPAQ